MCNPIDVVYRCHGGAFCKGGVSGERAVTSIKPWVDRTEYCPRPRQHFRLCAHAIGTGRYHNMTSSFLGLSGFLPTRKSIPAMARLLDNCRSDQAVRETAKDGWDWITWYVYTGSLPAKWCDYCLDKGIPNVFWSYMNDQRQGMSWSWEQCHDYFVANISQEMMLWEAGVLKSTQESVFELDRWKQEMRRTNPGVFDDLQRWKEEEEAMNPGTFDDMEDGDEGFGPVVVDWP